MVIRKIKLDRRVIGHAYEIVKNKRGWDLHLADNESGYKYVTKNGCKWRVRAS